MVVEAVPIRARDSSVRSAVPVVNAVINQLLTRDRRQRWHGILDGHALHVTHLDGLLLRPLGRVVEELVQFALLGLSNVFLKKETEF